MNAKTLGTFVGALLIALFTGYMDIRNRVDTGQTEQRSHWIQDRQHKDSINALNDLHDSLDRQIILRKLDSIERILR